MSLDQDIESGAYWLQRSARCQGNALPNTISHVSCLQVFLRGTRTVQRECVS